MSDNPQNKLFEFFFKLSSVNIAHMMYGKKSVKRILTKDFEFAYTGKNILSYPEFSNSSKFLSYETIWFDIGSINWEYFKDGSTGIAKTCLLISGEISGKICVDDVRIETSEREFRGRIVCDWSGANNTLIFYLKDAKNFGVREDSTGNCFRIENKGEYYEIVGDVKYCCTF